MNNKCINICSMNVRGLTDTIKRRQVFNWMHNNNNNIFLIQESHSTERMEHIWNAEWGNKIHFSHGTSNSRGVCILTKGCNLEIKKSYHDKRGRILILDTVLNDQCITLINVYGPNNDDPGFYNDVHGILKDFTCESIICGGDFNCVLDINLDKKGGRAHTNFNAQNAIKTIMQDYDLIDIWRIRNPNVQRYTWFVCLFVFYLAKTTYIQKKHTHNEHTIRDTKKPRCRDNPLSLAAKANLFPMGS